MGDPSLIVGRSSVDDCNTDEGASGYDVAAVKGKVRVKADYKRKKWPLNLAMRKAKQEWGIRV